MDIENPVIIAVNRIAKILNPIAFQINFIL